MLLKLTVSPSQSSKAMASLFSLCCPSLRPCIFSDLEGTTKCRIISCNAKRHYQKGIQACNGTKRREAMFRFVFTAFLLPAIGSNALAENDGSAVMGAPCIEECYYFPIFQCLSKKLLILAVHLNSDGSDVVGDFQVYVDNLNKFKILIPQDWLVGSGETDGIKSVTAFYPAEASSSNVSVVITGLGPDFTRLESFGKVDAFAESLVNGLDRSWQRPPGVAAKLIDCKAANGLYYIEYSLQKPGESRRHLYSAIGMASNGWYNRLYTVTGQFVEDESEKYSSPIEKSVTSFKLI